MVLVVEKVRQGFRGRLTRWLLQVQAGVYVGHLSGRVRVQVWAKVCDEVDLHGGWAVLIIPASNEQGFSIHSRGPSARKLVDFDGLTLPKTVKSPS